MRRDDERLHVAVPLAATAPQDVQPILAEPLPARGTLAYQHAPVLDTDGYRPKGPDEAFVGNFVLGKAETADRPGRGEAAEDRPGIADSCRLPACGHKCQGGGAAVDRQGRDGLA